MASSLVQSFSATIYRVYCVDRKDLFYISGTIRPLDKQMDLHIKQSFDALSDLRLDQEMRKRGYKRFRITVEDTIRVMADEEIPVAVEDHKRRKMPPLNEKCKPQPLTSDEKKQLRQRKYDYKRREKQCGKQAALRAQTKEKRKVDPTFAKEVKEKKSKVNKAHHQAVQNDSIKHKAAKKKKSAYRRKRRVQGKDTHSETREVTCEAFKDADGNFCFPGISFV